MKQSSYFLLAFSLSTLTLLFSSPAATEPHSFHKDVPGQIVPVAWGWLGSVYYQQVPETGIGPDYYKEYLVDEIYKWGGNLINMYPTNWHCESDVRHGHPRPLLLKDDSGIEEYAECYDPRWTDEAFRELNRYMHERSMLSGIFACERLVHDHGAHPFVSTDKEIIKKNLMVLRAFSKKFSDCLTQDYMEFFDGFGWECWFRDDVGLTSEAAWTGNPGMFTYSTAVWPKDRAPNYSHGYMCAVPPQYVRGRDDQRGWPIKIGTWPLTYQADCRMIKQTYPAWKPWSAFTGGTYPDWILKQSEDYFRRQIIAGDRWDAQYIWWLGEPTGLLPREFRSYVYVASMDPIRHSAAAEAWGTGINGFGDRIDQGTKIGTYKRLNYPYDSAYIGNNYIRLYRLKSKDCGTFVLDPGRTGHFDNDSECVIIGDDFLTTVTEVEKNFTPVIIRSCKTATSETIPSLLSYEDELPSGIKADIKVGNFDSKNIDFMPAEKCPKIMNFELGSDSPSHFPSKIGKYPGAAEEINITVNSDSKKSKILFGHLPTQKADTISFRIDNVPTGSFRTKADNSNNSWLHILGPFDLSSRKTHTISFQFGETGLGFMPDAFGLLEDDFSGSVQAENAEKWVNKNVIEWQKESVLPPGLSGGRNLPDEMSLSIDLKPGRYILELRDVFAVKNSSYTIWVDDRFGPGFGLLASENSPAVQMAFTIEKPGPHTLKFTDNLAGASHIIWNEIELRKVSDIVITHKFDEFGGYIAKMTESIESPTYSELRRYTAINDFPAVRVDIHRNNIRNMSSKTLIQLNTNEVYLNGKRLKDGFSKKLELGWNQLVTGKTDSIDEKMVFALNNPHDQAKIRWSANKYLEIGYEGLGEVACEMIFGLPFEIYTPDNFIRGLKEAFNLRETAAVPAVIENELSIPLIKILKIITSDKRPYFVNETGGDGKKRWIFRGAQKSKTETDCDYVRLYLQPHSRVEVVPDGFIRQMVKPGIGNQHVLALSEITEKEGNVSLKVRVLQTGPHLFAPTLKFSRDITSAQLDGKEWHYFEKNLLHLPVEKKCFEVKVAFGGKLKPHLMRTCASITKAEFFDNKLVIEASLPPWSEQMPGELKYAFAVNKENKKLLASAAYDIIREESDKAIITADTGIIKIDFE